eukprot:8533494-Ditylum_brightwellii.AAC.1
MTIFRNTKETVTRIGHPTKINPVCTYHAHYQEQLNEALIVVVAEVEQEKNSYFAKYGTTMENTNFKAL